MQDLARPAMPAMPAGPPPHCVTQFPLLPPSCQQLGGAQPLWMSLSPPQMPPQCNCWSPNWGGGWGGVCTLHDTPDRNFS